MARNRETSEESPSTETPAVAVKASRTQNAFGGEVKYTLTGIPGSVEEYDAASSRPGACLETAIGHDIAHKFNAQARAAAVEALTKVVKETNPEAVIPDQADTETDTAYYKRLKEEGIVTKEQVDALEITIEFSGAGARSGGIAKKYKEIAEAAVKKAGSLEAAVSAGQTKLSALGIDYTIEPSIDSLAEAAKRMLEA